VQSATLLDSVIKNNQAILVVCTHLTTNAHKEHALFHEYF